jgi:hypothetical protein
MTPRPLIAIVLAGCGTSSAELNVYAQIDDDGVNSKIGVFAEQGDTFGAFDDASATLHVRGQSIELTGNAQDLFASYSLSPAAGNEEQFDLEIARDGATAHLVIGAPPAIDLDAPFPVFVPRSDDLTITWLTPSDDQMDWRMDSTEYSAECLDGNAMAIPAGATQVVVPSSAFVVRDDFLEPTCGSTFYLERLRALTGANDGFASAQLLYIRHLDIQFASTP